MPSRAGALAGPSYLAIAVAQRRPDGRFAALVNGAVRLHSTCDSFDAVAALATIAKHADPADAAALTGDEQLLPAVDLVLRAHGFRQRRPSVWSR